MTKTEEILKKHLSQKSKKFVNWFKIIEAQKQTALDFTKWKDENYFHNDGDFYMNYLKEGEMVDNCVLKTADQLFEEWNNLKE